jgi:hypothetical protein
MAITKKTAVKKTATKAAGAGVKTLTVPTSRSAKITTLITDIRKALGRTACGGCRSGIDRIILQDRINQ